MNALLKESIWSSIVVAMAFVCAMALSSERAFGMGGGPFGKGRIEDMQKLLGLSEDQIEQLQSIRTENRDAMQKARQEMMEARKQFRSVTKEATEEQTIRDVFKPVAVAMENMEVLKAKMFMEFKSVLTAEQLDKFKTLRKIMRGKGRHGGHGKFRAFNAGGPGSYGGPAGPGGPDGFMSPPEEIGEPANE